MPYQPITPKDLQCQTYSAEETRRILGVAKSTLLTNVHAGKVDYLRPIMIGTAIRFPRAVVDAVATGKVA